MVKNYFFIIHYFFYQNNENEGITTMTNKNLEELLVETEQRILNNDFYKEFTITYENEDYDFFVKPISQREFMKLYTKHKKDLMLMNEEVVKKCLVKEDGTNYPDNLLEILLSKMPAGFSTDVAKVVYQVSGIETDTTTLEKNRNFLEETP